MIEKSCNTCAIHKQTDVDASCRPCLRYPETLPNWKPISVLREDSIAAMYRIQPKVVADAKATNPKDAIGSTKLPVNLVPDTLLVEAAPAFLEGALKYGTCNWRVAGVRSSIYKAALQRHLAKWWNGQDRDPKTRVKHLASVIACATILLDAELVGKLTDDRPPAAPMDKLIDEADELVKHLKELFKGYEPVHHTIKDSQ
jgi:hypothetical protein